MIMKKPKLLCLGALLAMAFSLAACGSTSEGEGEGSGSEPSSKPYTVIYYDDAPTPQKIGYSYVKPGATAIFPVHLSKAADGGAYEDGYDYLSRGRTLPVDPENENRPMALAFDTFKGTYEDGTDVNLKNIQGDCTVYASFKKEAAPYSYTIQNGNTTATYMVEAKETAYDRKAEFPHLPVLPADGKLPDDTYLTDDTLSWFEENTFEGYTLSSKGSTIAGADVEVNTSAVIASTADLHFDPMALPRGEASTNKFHFWIDSSYDETNKCYPFNVYFSDGTEWHSLGSLIQGLSLVFQVKYTANVEKDFTATVFENEYQAKFGGEPLVNDLKVHYLNTITAAAPVDNGAGKFDNALSGVNNKVATTVLEPESWAGFYTGPGDFQGDDFSFDGGVSAGIQTDCSIYPVKKLRVHVYDSRDSYEQASVLASDLNPDNDEWSEVPELMYVNYSGEITYAKVGDITVLTTSLAITRLRFDNPAHDAAGIIGFVCYDALGKTSSDPSNFLIGQEEAAAATMSIVSECYLFPLYA